ncbi:MAG: ATP phosphoribosyltransferase regulatory subunit, partial [archaeon]
MIPEIENVKGFQDFLPPESLKRASVKKVIEKHFRLHGFLPIETPLIEFDELMRPDTLEGNEDAAISDRFRLKDRGGRNLGLRYEFTFQLKRLLKQHPNIKLPFRRFQIGEVFRDEPIGPGRFRQFTQCDVDILGDESMDSDVECLSLVADIFKELKIPFEIHINNRKLLSAIIESVEMRDKQSVMRELDKLDKIGEDLVKSNLLKYGDGNQILTLFKLMQKDLDFFKKNAFDGANEIIELSEKCAQQGIKIIFNPN